MDEIRTDGDPIAWRMWSTWEDRVKVDDFNVFSGLESGAAAHNKLGEFLTFASAQNCSGCRLCQL